MRVAAHGTGMTAGSTTLPSMSLYSSATNYIKVREVGIFNTTTTAARYGLVRLTTTGTQGTGITETVIDGDNTATIGGTAFAAHSVAPTLGGFICPLPMGAAVGAGTVMTWYGENNGILIPRGVANGVGIILLSGTGQVFDGYIYWDE